MSGKIVVAGDAHLGAEHADVAAFNDFLESRYRRRDELQSLVLLGDVWDMIRRDPFGCAWETSETITQIKRLADEIPVYFVFGNHDTHLRHLDSAFYDVQFHDDLVMESGDTSIRFCHGKSFDRLQFDALSNHLSGPGDRGDIDPTNGLKDPIVAKGRDIVQTQKRRLRSTYESLRSGDAADVTPHPRREQRAHAYLERIPEDKLVYGHTHNPYVHPDNVAANPGSWKSTAPVHNTYLVIENGDLALYRHSDGDDDELVDPVAMDDGPATEAGRPEGSTAS
ncbi:metallophosphoesterase [Haloarchaeobius sp. HRN-SO-5]|uniref:metallophosphoesterase n=1 Tax=Haloarchaeobius sp. HRN-SO-5 TaxID=3446118 RepID=UPI003EB99CAF